MPLVNDPRVRDSKVASAALGRVCCPSWMVAEFVPLGEKRRETNLVIPSCYLALSCGSSSQHPLTHPLPGRSLAAIELCCQKGPRVRCRTKEHRYRLSLALRVS